MDVLNADYEPTGLKFVLSGVDYTINQDWFMNGGPQTFGFLFSPFFTLLIPSPPTLGRNKLK